MAGNEWRYLKECLDSNWVSSVGPFVTRFENELAARVGVSCGVATVNGTAALHIALLVMGVGPGDMVLVPALTFIAPANSVRYTGALAAFVDVDPQTAQMDPGSLRRFLENECRRSPEGTFHVSTGARVKAAIPVHALGHPAHMDLIREVTNEFDLRIVEDATESLGASYKDQPVGSFGDIACFSFNGNKLLTTGGGGMLVTNDRVMAEKARYLTSQAKDDPVEYVHESIGYNYRLTGIQAAMGCAQLEQLDHFIARKRAIARRYDAAIGNIPGIRPIGEASWARSACWMYTVEINADELGIGSRELLAALDSVGIQTRPLWRPIPDNKPYWDAPGHSCPAARRLYENCLSLPCSVGLTDQDQDRVIKAICSAAVYSTAGRARGGSA